MIDLLLITLGLLPSNDNFRNLKKKLHNISTFEISKLLLKYRFRGLSDRKYLIKRLKLSKKNKEILLAEISDSKDIWDDIRYCGSGITKSMFSDIQIEGEHISDYLILKGRTYSKPFLERFDLLWEKDKALRKIEWGYLKIPSLQNRNKILQKIDFDAVETILDSNSLMDIIQQGTLVDEIIRELFGKLESVIDSDHLELFKNWLELDFQCCVVVLAYSLDKNGIYNLNLLMERFSNRIRSSRKLTKQIDYNLLLI